MRNPLRTTAANRLMPVLRRAAAFGAAGAFAVGVVLALPVASGTAYAAATPTINCDQASAGHTARNRSDWKTCQKLQATASCVWANSDGTWTIALGYKNPTASDLYAAIPDANGNGGTNNALTATNGTADNPDHLSTFWTGTSVTAFTVTWRPTSSSDPVTWNLMGKTYTFTDRSEPRCSTKPVPIFGNAAAIGLGAALLLGAFFILERRHLKRAHQAQALRDLA